MNIKLNQPSSWISVKYSKFDLTTNIQALALVPNCSETNFFHAFLSRLYNPEGRCHHCLTLRKQILWFLYCQHRHDPTTRKYITYYAFTSNPNIQARLENPNLAMISTDRVTPPEICCCNILSSTFVRCPSECHHQFSGVQSDSEKICGDSSSDYVSRPRQLLRLFICFWSDVKENKAEGRIQCLFRCGHFLGG